MTITFDFDYIEGALAMIEAGDRSMIKELARLPAIDHIRRHMSQFGVGALPTREQVVRDLALPLENARDKLPAIRRALEQARKCDRVREPWLRPLRAFLPSDFTFGDATVYLTFGYDVGVVSDGHSASVNLAHPLLTEHPDALRYFLMHELHHVAYLNYHRFVRVRDIASREDLVDLVQRLTHLEGLGTYAPWDSRRVDGAIEDDPDYTALEDEELMRELEGRYWTLYGETKKLPRHIQLREALPVLEAFGTPNKLFHLVGARLARRVAETAGREALVQTIVDGPAAFLKLARESRKP